MSHNTELVRAASRLITQLQRSGDNPTSSSMGPFPARHWPINGRGPTQNAASAEESASASSELNAQAEKMNLFVSELVTLAGGVGGSDVETAPLRGRR